MAADPDPVYNEEVMAYLERLQHMPTDVRTCGLILGSLCTVSSLFGNLLIAVIFLLDKGLRQRQNVFVISAAIMEVIIVCVRDFFLLAVYFDGGWYFGTAMLYMNGVIFYSRNGLAIGHVIALTVYRYALIVRPKAYRILSRTPVIAFTLVLLVTVPVGWASLLYKYRLHFNTKVMFAVSEGAMGIRNGTLTDDVNPYWVMPIFFYVLVNGAVLVVFNVHLYLFIRKSSRRVGGATGDVPRNDIEPKACRRISYKEARFVKIMLVIFAMFIVCYFPIPIAITTDPGWQLSHWSYLPLLLLNWFSSSVSWMTYVITHTPFRVAVLKRIKCSPVNFPERSPK